MSSILHDTQRKAIYEMAQKNPEKSNRAIAKVLGICKDTVARYRGENSGTSTPLVKPAELPEQDVVEGTRRTITLPKTKIQTMEELVEACKIDTGLWNVDRFVCKKWDMGYKDGDGEGQAIQLFSVSAYMSKKVHVEEARAEIERLKEAAKTHAPVPVKIKHKFRDSGNLLELALPDLHAGKLSWSKETGYQDYDTDIAVETYERAVDHLLADVSHYAIDKIVLVVGNDLLQSDNLQSTTTKGTKVDTDSRYQRTYVSVRRMLVRTVEKLRNIAPVSVKVVPGNHDNQSAFTMGDSLECFFAKYKDVSIDNAPTQSKYFHWGKCLVALTHGDKGVQNEYGLWMATEWPELFGQTQFREVHVGHLHKQAVNERYGVKIRTLSALCPPDAWHSANKYTGNLRSAEALVWNKTAGLKAQFYHTEPSQRVR